MVNPTSTLIGKALAGLLVLLPLAILGLAAMEIWGLLETTAAFAALELPFPPVVNALIYIAVAALAIFLTCLFTGVLMSTGPGKKFAQFVEKSITEKIPLLGLVRNLTMSITGAGSKQINPVEINLYGDGSCQFGFLMETLPDSRCVVFIPGAPAVTMGQTYIVPAERVKLLDVPISAVANTITQWGAGAGEIYRTK